MRPTFCSKLLVLFMALVLSACSSMPRLFGPSLAERLEDHVTVLASDEFEGRGTGSEGFDKAATYAAEVMGNAGVQPGADNWRQDVPLIAFDPESIRGSLSIIAGDEILELEDGESVAYYPPSDGVGQGYRAEASGGIVFVGDGVVAPTLGMNPYAKVDVRGKIVAMFRGSADIEDNATYVHVRRFDVKRNEAVKRGAVGVLYLDPRDRDLERLAGFRASHPEGSLSLGAGYQKAVPTALINLDTVRTLFEASGRDFDETLEALKDGTAESFEMEAIAALSTQADAVPIDTFNVVGVVPGTDPSLAKEAVVVTAHLDHLGMRQLDKDEEPRDTIYNGALDNATGTAIVLEAAAALSKAGGAARTVIFAAVTAEEAGLLGSAHLARNIDELGYTAVANVNIDMPVLTYPLNDVIGFGEGYSSLREPLSEAAAAVGLVSSPDPLPELSLFVRSDHYRFVQEGIPALFLFNGMSGEGKENFQAFMSTHYHRVSDQVDLPINWQDGAKLTRLTIDLVIRIANDPERPTWNPGVVFAPQEPQG